MNEKEQTLYGIGHPKHVQKFQDEVDRYLKHAKEVLRPINIRHLNQMNQDDWFNLNAERKFHRKNMRRLGINPWIYEYLPNDEE